MVDAIAGHAPELSVVIQTDRWETIAPVVDRLGRQTAKHRIELVLISEAPGPLERASAAVDGFASIQVIPAGPGDLSSARRLGVEGARAPIVFLGETHSYAGAEWAERLLEAHREWDVVVPCFGNANPKSALSWAAFLQDYGYCGEGRPAGEPNEWPGLNVSYRRSVLQALGGGLDAALHSGDVLRSGIRDTGAKVCFAPSVRVAHLNVDHPRAWIHERFLRGLLIAASRRRGWSFAKRLGYTLAAPLIAVVLMRRHWPTFSRASATSRLPPGTGPAWVVGFLIRAAGEAVGYAFGAGMGAWRAMEEYETHKVAYTRAVS